MVVKIEQQKNFALKGVEMGMLGLTGGSGNGFLNWKSTKIRRSGLIQMR